MKTPNEVVYGFTPNFAIDPTDEFHHPFPAARSEVIDALDLAAMSDKLHYDQRHTAMFLAVGRRSTNNTYDLSMFSHAYKLDIPAHWRVHLVFTIAQLEPAPPGNDPFNRPRPTEPGSVFVEGDREHDKRTVRKGRGTSV